MSVLKFLIEKEFKQTLRNAFIPKLIVFYPVMVLLVFPWAINFEVKNIRIDVVDNSKSTLSRRLVEKIEGSSYFILNQVAATYEEAMDDVERKHAHVVLEIPAMFENQLIRGEEPKVRIAANAVNSTEGLLGNSYLTQIINEFSQEIRLEKMPVPPTVRQGEIEMIPNYRYNPTLDYKRFMLPAFIVLIVTLICGIMPSMNIVSEKETGTIQQINTTPISKYTFILSKLIPYWIIGLLIVSISFFVTWLIYGLLPAGGFGTLYLASTIFIIGISGMGIIVSNYSETLQQSMFLIMFLILIILLLSGLFTPIASMPPWAKVIAYSNPLTYFIQIMRLVYLKGSSLGDIAKPLMLMVMFAFILNGWAVLSYRKRG